MSKKVLMVCLGNICRSPLAHGILQKEITARGLDWEVDSAGTANFHSGEAPDIRSVKIGLSRGVDIRDQKARGLVVADITHYDHILAMDTENYNNILSLVDDGHLSAKVEMLLNYSHPGQNRAVPDPYYSGGFDYVFDMISEGVQAFVLQHTS